MNESIGSTPTRVDGRAKVTGQARYAGDFRRPRQAHAVVVGATIGRGRIVGIEVAAVQRLPGVIAVVSHLNAPKLAYRSHKGAIDPAFGERLHVLQDDEVRFFGQPVAIVVAETLDQAEHAALAVPVRYQTSAPQLSLSGAEPVVPEAGKRPGRSQADRSRGDAESALRQAAVRIDEAYEIARENHTPIELHATLAEWNGDRLTLWSKSQFVVNEQAELAAIFGIPPENVEVVCPFIGGAFGTSLRTWPHVSLAAIAARQTGRPVMLTLSRRQSFFTTGHRPRTIQRVALGASADGKLTGLVHEGTGETSRYEQFVEALTANSSFMYACPNVATRYRLAELDISTPTFMRGPGEASGVFALECAMDELAHALKLDPVELRRRNEPIQDESENRPFSSRSLLQCYETGAERFGWSGRNPVPRSMRDGRLMIGWGMATSTYPVLFNQANARVRMQPDGTADVEAAASDMGPGTYTSMTQVAADALGLPMDRVRFRLGRSDFPATPPHGGSQTMASVGSAVRAACLSLQDDLIARAIQVPGGAFAGAGRSSLSWRDGRLHPAGGGASLGYAEIVRAAGGKPVMATGSAGRDPQTASRFSMHAFGAVFAEVAIDPAVRTIRVRRIVGAYGAGRIVNPRLALSQCTGGMVGGIGMALMEATALDTRDGRPVNAHMADYLVPVNLDIGQLEAHFVPEDDPHVNPLGVKGLGEIALVGVAPAIANAVFHATGIRVRSLPIRIDHLLDGPPS